MHFEDKHDRPSQKLELPFHERYRLFRCTLSDMIRLQRIANTAKENTMIGLIKYFLQHVHGSANLISVDCNVP